MLSISFSTSSKYALGYHEVKFKDSVSITHQTLMLHMASVLTKSPSFVVRIGRYPKGVSRKIHKKNISG